MMRTNIRGSRKERASRTNRRRGEGGHGGWHAARRLLSAAVLAIGLSLHAGDERAQDFRITPVWNFKPDDKNLFVIYTAFIDSWSKDLFEYQLVPAYGYNLNRYVQLIGGYGLAYKDYDAINDTLEQRPFAGIRFWIAPQNRRKISYFNFLRYEYRSIADRVTGAKTSTDRFRNRLGVEVPLGGTHRAWEPGAWHIMADIEPFYNLEQGQVEIMRYRLGPGYTVSKRLRLELIYHWVYSRKTPTGPMEYTDNIIRLNLKIYPGKGPRLGPRFWRSEDVDMDD